jgi:UDP-glucose 4-epimerase
MKILVTGGSGFVGRNLIPELMKKHEVCNMDIVDFEDPELRANVKTFLVDITDLGLLKRTFQNNLKDLDVIIHLAALSRENRSNDIPDDYFSVNAVGTYNMLSMVKGSKVKKFIFASSFLTYGNHPPGPVKETQQLFPSTVYAATKVMGEAFIRSFGIQFDFDFVIFRKCNIYGHKDSQKRIIDILLERAKANVDITLFGEKKLDFVDIHDVVRAYDAAVDYNGSDIFNIGSGEGRTLRGVAELIIRLTNSKSKIVMKEPNKGDIINFVADISKASQLLNFKPEGDLYKFVEEKIVR